ncbi:hypothetical protein E2C01_000623 [Portunus trituberculatus]|uniref:Uncharacterized protein n=1 Tax=Portunus trituberculatus TaxID=210409 RepID=A0A5B7CEL1_PORTR|nr:hypothetical protein [Portunus trituberculatus]
MANSYDGRGAHLGQKAEVVTWRGWRRVQESGDATTPRHPRPKRGRKSDPQPKSHSEICPTYLQHVGDAQFACEGEINYPPFSKPYGWA